MEKTNMTNTERVKDGKQRASNHIEGCEALNLNTWVFTTYEDQTSPFYVSGYITEFRENGWFLKNQETFVDDRTEFRKLQYVLTFTKETEFAKEKKKSRRKY